LASASGATLDKETLVWYNIPKLAILDII
jgi:hypothetical protein